VKSRWTIVVLSSVWVLASAQERAELSQEELAAEFPGIDAKDVLEAPVPGMYEVAIGSSVAYVSKDGRYILQGDLYDLDDNANLTERRRSTARVEMLSKVDPETMIVFSPGGDAVKHVVTIFTDIDCGYCRQFHREIAKVNALGIEVHYLFYPRTGPDTESWYKAEKVWCAEDRKTALTEAKLGGQVPDDSCESNPVESHYDLGNLIGVRGTPSIFAANGEQLGGYVAPDELLELLEAIEP
jgi:thiol:disulfide interchange protein DsbC